MLRVSMLASLGCWLWAMGCSGPELSNTGEESGVVQNVDGELVAADPCATVTCEGGTHCVALDNVATCEPHVFCGGIAGFACPGAGQCVDDPNDDCDPENGGADCGGLCECSGAAVLCIEGTVFDESPEVCACIEQQPENPCNLIDCFPGDRCRVNDGEPECVADVQCGGFAGDVCPGAGTCIDDPNDGCDPEAGGADCGGSCECSGALVLCAPNTVFDDSPEVCECVPASTLGCEAVLCLRGTQCVERDGQARCVPNRHGHRGKRWKHRHARRQGHRNR